MVSLRPLLLGAFLNGTGMPHGYDYYKPLEPFVVNGRPDPTSQRFHVSNSLVFSRFWIEAYEDLGYLRIFLRTNNA